MKRKVLIVEDDAGTAEMLEYLMEFLKYDVVLANNILPVSEIESISPNLILLDHKLSNGPGGALCQNIKTHLPAQKIPVIMVSAHHDAGKIARACGADDYITKPFSISEMEKKIERLLLAKEMQAERPS